MHYARMSRSSRLGRARFGAQRFGQHEFKQRCAVRVSYSPNRSPGQWKAHGHYLARDSANPDHSKNGFGFGATSEPLLIAATLNRWQTAGDQRLFKIII